MSVVEPDSIEDLREPLRMLKRPFLMRSYEATPEDYEAIDDEDFKCEYFEGELVVHSPASLEHEQVVVFVSSLLREFASRRRLGTVYGSNAVMQLGLRRFSPDVSYLSTAGEVRVRGGRLHGPMDLVVEIHSSSTRAYDRGDKLRAYQEGRVPEIWLIDADEKRFEGIVLRDGNYDRRGLRNGVWSSVVVPGLSLDVSWLWRRPLPSLDECRAVGR
ncbi:MAG: Uma2 family endonuclease [Phycisphaerales bacterium]|nr:Uma2 family endonuclease [Phycisphaerales bacterium]